MVKEWSKLKGTTGFCVTWLVLMIYSSIIFHFDLKLGIMGIIISVLFGFLGFDMLGDLATSKRRKVTK